MRSGRWKPLFQKKTKRWWLDARTTKSIVFICQWYQINNHLREVEGKMKEPFDLVVTLNYFGIHLITLLPVSRSVLSPFSSISSMLYSSFLLGVILFISQWFSGSMSRRYLSRSLSLMSGCCFSMFSISCWCSPSLYSWVVYASRLVDWTVIYTTSLSLSLWFGNEGTSLSLITDK